MLEQQLAASTAPSASNKQAWKFVVIQKRSVILEMVDLVEAASHEVVDSIDDTLRDRFATYIQNFSNFGEAPVVIAVLHREVELLARALKAEAEPELTRAVRLFENQSSLVSSSLALQNLLLMAEHLGLGSCCMTGPLIADEELLLLLSMPEGWKITAFVAVGWPDESPETPPRKKRELIAKWVK